MEKILPRRVHCSRFTVHGFFETVSYRLSTIDTRQRRSGFSLIELLVVIALFAMTTILVTTSYIGFEAREKVKNGALQLKSDLRYVQNKSQTGDKGVGGAVCAIGNTLSGWFIDISDGATSYSAKGNCTTLSGTYADNVFDSKVINLPTGVSISSIKYNGVEKTRGYIYFKPLDYSVTFFDQSTTDGDFINTASGVVLAGLTGANPDEMVIVVHSPDGEYEVKVSRSGQIKENRL